MNDCHDGCILTLEYVNSAWILGRLDVRNNRFYFVRDIPMSLVRFVTGDCSKRGSDLIEEVDALEEVPRARISGYFGFHKCRVFAVFALGDGLAIRYGGRLIRLSREGLVKYECEGRHRVLTVTDTDGSVLLELAYKLSERAARETENPRIPRERFDVCALPYRVTRTKRNFDHFVRVWGR